MIRQWAVSIGRSNERIIILLLCYYVRIMYYVLALCLYCFYSLFGFLVMFIPTILMCSCRILIKITYLLTTTRLRVAATARVLASQAEAIVRTGKTWPQATKRRN